MRYSLFFVLLFIAINGNAQENLIDSLKVIIDNYGDLDTTYVAIKSKYISQRIYSRPNDSTLLSDSQDILDVSNALDYKKGQVLAYQRLGIIYHYILSDPLKAIDAYQRSMDVIDVEPKLKRFGIVSLGNIATIYYEQQDYREAIKRYRLMLNYKTHKINAYTNIGNCYSKLRINDSSIYFYEQAEKLARTNNDVLNLANILSNLSLVQSEINELDKSIPNIAESISLITDNELEMLRTPTYINAAMVYLAHKDYDKAEKYAKEALTLNQSIQNLYTDKTLWETLSTIYVEKKDYKNALNAFKKYTVLNDSITSSDRKTEISRKEIQYEADKQQTIAVTEIKKQKLLKRVSVIGGSSLIVAFLIGFILYRKKQNATAKTQKALFKVKVSNTELKALRAQMNPHFIFNSLNSIGDYILKNDITSASDYLSKFSILIRQTLENSEKKDILLSEDVNLIKRYLDIENKRFKNSFTYKIIIDKLIDADNTLIPPLILQPFIENSIKHGLSIKENKGHIVIEAIKKGDMILYVVDDNGIGMKTSYKGKQENEMSLGMKITKNRIDIINQLKKTNGDVKVVEKDKGIRVEVLLPLDLAF